MAYYWKNKNDKFITIFTANEHKCSQTLIGHIVMSVHLSVCVCVCVYRNSHVRKHIYPNLNDELIYWIIRH